MSAILDGEVVRAITAVNGSPSRCAKNASLTAVEPDDASTTWVPSWISPLHRP